MSKSADRLSLLTTFARIAERGSISAAARDLGLSQASASRHLKDLEDRLGVQLVHRTTHALSLTLAGDACLADARMLLDGWEALVETHAEEDADVRGPLKVIAPVALGQLHLADAALDFQRQFPNVDLAWQLTDDSIRFSEVGCDLWIKVGAVPDDRLIAKPLAEIERMIVSAPDFLEHRAINHPKDLHDLPCVAVEPFEGQSIPLASARGATYALKAAARVSTNNIFTAQRAALKGLGFAVMPRWLVEYDLKAGRLLDLLPRWRAPRLTLHAAYLPQRRQTKRLRLFIAHMSEAILESPGIEPPR